MSAPGPVDNAGRNRRIVIILGAILAVVIIIFALTQLTKGSSPSNSATTSGPPAIPPRHPPTHPGSVPTTTTVPPTIQNPSAASFKDPFIPLQGPSAASATTPSGGASPTGGTTVPTATTATTGLTPPAGSPPATVPPATSPSSGGAPPPAAPTTHVVKVVDVYPSGSNVMASVGVDGTLYQVGVGQVFDQFFRVIALSLSTGCGEFQYGDSSFLLCKGQQTVK
ncbi:MAG: hypothetical protein ACRD0I_06755 [Acidimicrobiales bacterium]